MLSNIRVFLMFVASTLLGVAILYWIGDALTNQWVKTAFALTVFAAALRQFLTRFGFGEVHTGDSWATTMTVLTAVTSLGLYVAFLHFR